MHPLLEHLPALPRGTWTDNPPPGRCPTPMSQFPQWLLRPGSLTIDISTSKEKEFQESQTGWQTNGLHPSGHRTRRETDTPGAEPSPGTLSTCNISSPRLDYKGGHAWLWSWRNRYLAGSTQVHRSSLHESLGPLEFRLPQPTCPLPCDVPGTSDLQSVPLSESRLQGQCSVWKTYALNVGLLLALSLFRDLSKRPWIHLKFSGTEA